MNEKKTDSAPAAGERDSAKASGDTFETRRANKQTPERVRKFGEIFTPHAIVVQMCDALERESPEAFEIGSTFLEPSCGDGIFVLEILRRKFARCKKRADFTTALASVYAMDIQADNVADTIANIKDLCLDYFKPTAAEAVLICDHVIQCDSLKIMRMLAREDLSHEIYCFPKQKDRAAARWNKL